MPPQRAVEEAALAGGFGSAVLEVASEMQLAGNRLRCLGVPDRFIEHGDRQTLLGELGLDGAGIAESCRQAADQAGSDSLRQKPGSVEEMTS